MTWSGGVVVGGKVVADHHRTQKLSLGGSDLPSVSTAWEGLKNLRKGPCALHGRRRPSYGHPFELPFDDTSENHGLGGICDITLTSKISSVDSLCF